MEDPEVKKLELDPEEPLAETETVVPAELTETVNEEVPAPTVENSPAATVPSAAPKSERFGKKQKLLLVAVLVGALFLAWWFLVRKETVTAPDVVSQTQEQAPRLGVAVGLVEGTVEHSKDGQEWSALSSATELVEGDSVRAAEGGRVVLLIDDGSAVRLGSGAQVTLKSLSVSDVQIDNRGGEVYTRVVASESRKFSVSVGEDSYEAKGTAYRTFNKDTKKGVEVYHSAVATKDKEVPEGNALLTLSEQKEKENLVIAIDLEAMKQDEFLKWNTEEDKKTAEFADKLGVLAEFDKPAPVTPKPAPAPSAGGITLSGSVSEYSAKFSWKVSGVDTSQGYKLVKSKTSKTPTYPGDSAAYIEAGKSSYSLFLGDGKTYYFRICAYRGDSCVSYSNTVTITTPVKAVEKVVSGAVSLSLNGNVASWTFAGTAPHGFKLVISADPNTPSYGNALKTKYVGSPHTIDYLDAGTYNVRVCKYTASDEFGGCTDYSNMVSLVVP